MAEKGVTSPLDIAGFATSLIGSIIGGVAGQNETQWLKGLLMQILQTGDKNQARGLEQYSNITNSMLPLIQQGANTSGSLLNGPEGLLSGITDLLKGQQQQIPGMFSGAGDWKGGNADLASQLQGILTGGSGTKDLANQVFAGGGWTPQGQQGFDQISKLLGGPLQGTSQGMGAMNDLFSNGGGNDFTRQLQNTARQTLSDGGVTGVLQTAGDPLMSILGAGGDTGNNDILRQFGLDALETGGFTGSARQGVGSALEQVLSGGETPTTQGLQDRGLELFGREALLPIEQVLSFARDEAGRASRNQFEGVQRRALARGGGPAALSQSGMAQGVMGEFADETAENQANAVMKALLGQQQLRQNEQLAGANAASQGANAATSRFGAGGDLLSSLESGATARYKAGGDLAQGANQNETQRLLSALGIVPDIQNSATNVMGTLGNLGVQGAGVENDRTGLATNLLKILTGNELGQNQVGLESLIKLLGNQNQYALGAGQLGNDIMGTQGSLMNALLGNNIAGGELDLKGITALVNALQQGTKNNIDFGSLLSGNFSNNLGAAQEQANPWMQHSGSGTQLIGSLAGTNMQNPYANLGQQGGR